MDAAACQYLHDCRDLTPMPSTGLDVWVLVAVGLTLICVGLAFRELR